MRKFLALLIAIIVVSACEKDDFCVQGTVTPNLVLRFYDDLNRTSTKPVTSLYIWAENKDTIFKNVSTDSIAIPLNSFDTETVYNLSKGNVINQFTISYTTENEYVSRSCGFKVMYNDVTFSANNTWFTDFTPATLTTIDNQNKAHVQIFH